MVFAKIVERRAMDGESFRPPTNPASAPMIATPATVECPHCGAQMAPKAAFCPACGWSMTPVPPLERAVAAAGYLPLVPAAVILFLPTYRRHLFVRFHAWQSIFLWIVFLVLTVVAVLLSNLAASSLMAFLLLGILASLGMLFLWFVLSLKAWQGERFALPFFGVLAARMR
jgi:uncharacterized membrane protein